MLTSIALKSYSAAAFKATVASASERNSAAATSFIFFIFKCDASFSFMSLCVNDFPSTAWNYADQYNLLISELNDLWMSAWTVGVALPNFRLHLLTCHTRLIETMWVHINHHACLQ